METAYSFRAILFLLGLDQIEWAKISLFHLRVEPRDKRPFGLDMRQRLFNAFHCE